VLYVAAYTTRNWTLNEKVSRKQINDLSEAVYEIPSILTHWRSTEEFEQALKVYLNGYIREWKKPDLLAIYKQAKKDANS